MNRVMAGPANPERAGGHIFLAEQLLEAFLSVQVLGNQMMAGEPANGALAEFTIVGLGREFEHLQVIIRARR